MGDRTTCRVYVLVEHMDRAIALIGPEEGESSDTYREEASPVVCLFYEDVNYASIDALDEFPAEGIAYDFEWDSGGDYSEGEQHLRFTPEGEAIFTSDNPECPSSLLSSIITALTTAPSVEYIQGYLADRLAQHTPLSWDNQVEYGKLYRARQLIEPKK